MNDILVYSMEKSFIYYLLLSELARQRKKFFKSFVSCINFILSACSSWKSNFNFQLKKYPYVFLF